MARRLGAFRPAPAPVLLERERLTQLLGNSHSHRVLLLCGPVGSGKTTAVRHYLERANATEAYYRLCDSDSAAGIEKILSGTADSPELVIDDVDAFHARVTSAGAELVKALRSEPWGMREFGVRTIDGHRIMFAAVIP